MYWRCYLRMQRAKDICQNEPSYPLTLVGSVLTTLGSTDTVERNCASDGTLDAFMHKLDVSSILDLAGRGVDGCAKKRAQNHV